MRKARSATAYRRQILTFKQQFSSLDCTVLLLDDRSAVGPDVQVQSIVHGMLALAVMPLKFGVNRRYLAVSKLRGSDFREGNHDYGISRGGLTLYPRLVAADYRATFERRVASSGNGELDKLVGGGLDAGTSNLLMGLAGSGKSTVASLFVNEAAKTRREVDVFRVRRERAHADVARAGNGSSVQRARRQRTVVRQGGAVAERIAKILINKAVCRHRKTVRRIFSSAPIRQGICDRRRLNHIVYG